MLDFWYQNALLFWYCFFNLFTDNIKANLETKFGGLRKSQLRDILASLRFGNKVRRPKGKPINELLHDLSVFIF